MSFTPTSVGFSLDTKAAPRAEASRQANDPFWLIYVAVAPRLALNAKQAKA